MIMDYQLSVDLVNYDFQTQSFVMPWYTGSEIDLLRVSKNVTSL